METYIMETYRIIAKCDPYNARKHYRGEKVVKYDGATPIWWIMEEGMTKDEALERLHSYVDMDNDLAYFNMDMAVEFDREIEEETGEKVDPWFKGEGYYINGEPVYLLGETSWTDDSMTYVIEEEEEGC